MDLQPYKRLPWYPHMKPADVAIWNRFIEQYPFAYLEVCYDCDVGEGRPTPPGHSPELEYDWKILTRKKIDAIGWTDAFIDVIEIKPNATMNAIGQALSYAHLFSEQVHPDLPVLPTIVTDQLLPDMPALAKKYGIKLFVV